MDLADRLTLHELPGRYGDLIDDRDWDGLSTIFTEDATFAIPDQLLDGLEAIRAFMREAKHPRTHAMTNVYADDVPGTPAAAGTPGSSDRAIVRFRIIGMRRDGRIISGRYRDEVVRTPDGWRVRTRVYTSTPYEET